MSEASLSNPSPIPPGSHPGPQARAPKSKLAISILVCGVLAVIATLAGLANSAMLKAKQNADHAKIVSELKIVGLDLDEFSATDGRYPDSEEFFLVTELPAVSREMKENWVYFPMANPEENVPLLISPSTHNKSAVLFTDIQVKSLSDDEVVHLLQTSDAEPFEIEKTIRTKF
ncbi:MAG: hypothetical protein ACON5H_07050 [Akkermansiaceae bacterium]